MPRMLRGVHNRSIVTTALGRQVAASFGIGNSLQTNQNLYGKQTNRFCQQLAPTAMQRMAHPDGECASAKGNRLSIFFFRKNCAILKKLHSNFIAAAEHGIVFILSTIATSSIEEIAAAAPDGNNWFQLYIYKDRYHHPYYKWKRIRVNGNDQSGNHKSDSTG